MDSTADTLVPVALRKGDALIIVRVVVCERPADNTPQPRTSRVERLFSEALESAT
jgi:hypothetical protein